MKIEEALKRVMEELRAMSPEEFKNRLEKSKQGGLYKDLKELEEFERYLIENPHGE